MKDLKIEVRVNHTDLARLDTLCRFFEMNRSAMVRECVAYRLIENQHLVDEYETYADYDQDRDGYNQRQIDNLTKAQCEQT